MFKDLKSKICELAFAAVSMAEQTLDSASGREKKDAAIEYIVSTLPLTQPFKSIVVFILARFIDESIERAVEYMNSIKNKEV